MIAAYADGSFGVNGLSVSGANRPGRVIVAPNMASAFWKIALGLRRKQGRGMASSHTRFSTKL